MNDIKGKITAQAKLLGADLIGFSNIERFRGSPFLKDPLEIFPQAKSVIGLGFRVLRGSTRGIEEGSTYYQYMTMAIENIEENIIPISLLRMSAFIEDMGYEAFPQKTHHTIMAEENDTDPEYAYNDIFRENKTEVQMDFRHAAIACGFGEIGLSGQILTPEFGPYQRFCFILTNAEIEPDPIFKPNLCDDCKECIMACPGNAFEENAGTVYLCDNEYDVCDLDNWQCAVYYKGAGKAKNPFMPEDAYADIPERKSILSGDFKVTPESAKIILDATDFYPGARHSVVASMCGRACDRACYIHLEKGNRLRRKFKRQFRKRDEWKLPV